MKINNRRNRLMQLVLIIIFLGSIFQISDKLKSYDNARVSIDTIRKVKNDKEIKNTNMKLLDINSDYKGWIKINNTNIDYPIVQSYDNTYYIDKDIKKNYSISGSIFLDYRNEMLNDKNTILYGHHMRDKSMFENLKKYKNQEFFNENGMIMIEEINGEKKQYEIFSVYVTDSNDEYLEVYYQDDKKYNLYLEKVISNSMHSSDVNVTTEDKILTLSTCSYETKDARLVVHAKLIM